MTKRDFCKRVTTLGFNRATDHLKRTSAIFFCQRRIDRMLYAVIMAGGSGTRFWPESRKNRPKQLLKIATEKTMIRDTVERILPVAPFHRVMVVTGASHGQEIRRELPELNVDAVVEEPVGRNTAPCVALAAYKLVKQDPNAIMAVLPADHIIGRGEEFLKHLRVAYEIASERDDLVTFGIKPDHPETGYGYIKHGPAVLQQDSVKAFAVESFVEKPDLETAKEYIAQGNYLWNSGMFVWNVSTIIRAFENHLPLISRAMEEISSVLNTPGEADAVEQIYQRMQNISIDNGIMEAARNVLVIPLDVAWNDVGSWSSLPEVWGADGDGNSVKGKAAVLDSKGCVISSPHKLTAIVGVEDLIVVDTPDALLVCHKHRSQDVKKLQALLLEMDCGDLL